jgi:glucose-6-phosphate 1-dehydrogenase
MSETSLSLGGGSARQPEDCGIIIFGASGDLTQRKLLPALYNLCMDQLLPSNFAIIGFARTPMTSEEFRAKASEAINKFSRRKPVGTQMCEKFEHRLLYCQGQYDDPESFRKLHQVLAEVERDFHTGGNWLYYLATPPGACEPIGRCLKEAGFVRQQDGKHWSRLIVEKPIGRDLASARTLNNALAAGFDESQTFRIDHYLGKETVQNILVMRFANGIFEPLWNHHHIDHVQITVAETVGTGSRGGYYDRSGALRDMVQNHLLQLLCLTAMDPPHNLGSDAIREEKLQILRSLRPIPPNAVSQFAVRGQYAAGLVSRQPAVGYREEAGVDPASRTETFVALKCHIDNWRWSGVPFYLRTGKRLAEQAAEISVFFRGVPPILFNKNPDRPIEPNVLCIRIQPNEGISLRIGSKVPGPRIEVRPVMLDFGYSSVFTAGTPEAYERLLLDVMLGDATLFMCRDEVEAAWGYVTRILEGWEAMPPEDFPNYMAGSWGPAAAEELLFKDGRRWRRL